MKKNAGFGLVYTIAAIVVIAAVMAVGLLVYANNNQEADNDRFVSNNTKKSKVADPYKGWKTQCDPEIKACYRYPADWIKSQYGGLENTAKTAYFSYQSHNTKDQSEGTAYIATIEDLVDPNQGLEIIGYITNNKPVYVIFDSSYVTEKKLMTNATSVIVDGNPTFKGRSGNDDVTFVATPNVSGYAAIKDFEQAKAWFSTPEAKMGLKILQSFYYQ